MSTYIQRWIVNVDVVDGLVKYPSKYLLVKYSENEIHNTGMRKVRKSFLIYRIQGRYFFITQVTCFVLYRFF